MLCFLLSYKSELPENWYQVLCNHAVPWKEFYIHLSLTSCLVNIYNGVIISEWYFTVHLCFTYNDAYYRFVVQRVFVNHPFTFFFSFSWYSCFTYYDANHFPSQTLCSPWCIVLYIELWLSLWCHTHRYWTRCFNDRKMQVNEFSTFYNYALYSSFKWNSTINQN